MAAAPALGRENAPTRRPIARRRAMCEPLEDRLMLARVLGIDISSHQPATVDWNQVKTGNGTTAPAYGWVLAKASEGTQFTDPHFAGYMSGAHAAGIPSGGYDFVRWDYNQGNSGADTEAAFFWQRVSPYIANGYMMPMLDIEWAGPGQTTYTGVPTQFGYTKTTFSQWVLRLWNDIVADGAAIGKTLTPIMYTSPSWSTYLDPTILVKVPIIVAAYPSSPNPQVDNPSGTAGWNTWSGWQYTDAGSVYGMGGTDTLGSSDADVLQGDQGVLQNFIIGSPGRYAVGTPFTVGTEIGTPTVYSNSDETATVGTEAVGATGTITADPTTGLTHAFGNGFWNWHVSMSDGKVGWMREYETPQGPSPHPLMDYLQAGMVTNISSTKANGTYNAGAVIPINVTFNGAMTVTGTPKISLNDGGTATYASGSGTNVLTFNYTVASGQGTSDLDLEDGWDAINLNLGTIKDSRGNYPDLMSATPGTAGSLGANKNIVIDTSATNVTGVSSTAANGTYLIGATIPVTVSFSNAVSVTGTPTIALNDGGTASYASGSGTSTLTFNYTVPSGQNSSDLDESSSGALSLNGGTIKNASSGANATLILPAPGTPGSLGANKAIVIDGTAPTITNVTSNVADGAYTVGRSIAIRITFDESVNVTGTPQLLLNDGALANYVLGGGTTTISFVYPIASGQNTADLDYASASALSLHGGTMKGSDGNDADLTLPTPGTTGSLGFNKNLIIDTTAPAAAYGAQTPNAGDTNLTFTVAYTDALSGIDYTTLDSSDVTVTGPNNFSGSATFVGVDLSSNGSPRTATYSIAAPGGTWDASDNGTYTVSQNASQVADVAGNFAASGSIGTFSANVPFAYRSGTTLNLSYAPGQTSISIGDDGSGNYLVTEGSSLSFAMNGINSILIHDVQNATDAVVVNMALAQPLAFDGLAASDSLTIGSGGSYTFGSDIGTGGANVAVAVSAAASTTFAASQHLSDLTIAGNAAVTAGQSVTLVTKALSVTGKLDLADGAIAVNYTNESPLGAWNNGAYDGITGSIVSGRNGGTWDGATGIVTTMPAALPPGATATIGAAEASNALGITGGATATWRGQTVDATTVLIRYTYIGDTNLDGVTNGDDYFNIDAGFSAQANGYAAGDFDLNGKINADDYFLIDSNYNKAQSPIVAAPIVTTAVMRSPGAELPTSPFATDSPTIGAVANDDAGTPVWDDLV